MNGGKSDLKAEHEDGEAGNNTDGDGIDIDGVVAHMPEDDMGAVDGMNDGEETGPSQDDIGGTTSSVSAPSTAIPTLARERAGRHWHRHQSWHRDDRDPRDT